MALDKPTGQPSAHNMASKDTCSPTINLQGHEKKYISTNKSSAPEPTIKRFGTKDVADYSFAGIAPRRNPWDKAVPSEGACYLEIDL